MYQDFVALLPGLLGFSHFGGFYYFADRVASSLRGALELETGRAVPVIPLSTLPAGSLERRHQYLLGALAKLDGALGGVERIHLVGHSAGGLDAFLLTQEHPFPSIGDASIRGKIRAVVTVAAPFYGSGLAATDFAQALAAPLARLAGLPTVGKTLLDVVRFASRDPELPVSVTGALQDWQESIGFLRQLLQHRDLIQDLRPDRMADLQARCKPDPNVPARLTCFVTATAPPMRDQPQSDPLYRDLYGLTGGGVSNLPPAAKETLHVLDQCPADKIIQSTSAPRLVPGPSSNDGIVNSAFQLAHPGDPSEFGGLVIADHGDVLGHYPRVDILTAIDGGGSNGKKAIHAGLFHSGAGFRDDQFFDLYRRIATKIREACG
jgi:hypothetical protein